MRKVLLVAVITVVVLFGGLLIAPSFVDWNVYKGQVTNQVAAATGRDLRIDGDLSLTLIPRPTLVASGVRVGNIDGAGNADMIRLRTALVRVALAPLLRGRIAVDSVVLVQPQISLERLADGRVNWAFSGPEEDDATAGTTPAQSQEGFALPPVAFNDISIEDGTIVFRDAGTGNVRRFERINARVAAGSLQGPFRAEGSVSAVGVPFELRAEIGRLVEDRAIPVSFSADIGDGGTTAEFSGVLSGFPIQPRLSGRLSAQGTGTAATLSNLLAVNLPVIPDSELNIAGDLAANTSEVAFNGIELSFGESTATGSINVALEPKLSADISIGVSRLDIDSLSIPDNGSSQDQARSEPGSESAPIEVVPGARSTEGFVLPQDIDVAVEARIEAIVYRGNIIRQTRLAGELTNGELTISQASAQLPGGADVTMFGFVMAAEGGEPIFDGQVEANADNLRGLLTWLSIPTDGVPADRLRKMELAADIRATPAQITISNTDAQIDLSRIRGGVAVALRERPGLGIGFSIDKLNLDAYLAGSRQEVAEPTDETVQGSEDAEPAPLGLDLSGLAFLNSFDSIMQFQVGSLTYKRIPVQGINFDGTLQAGNLELRQASVAELAGTAFSASGELTNLGSAAPSVAVDVSLDSEDAGRFLEALGLDPPDRSGPVTIQGRVAGDAAELTIGADISVQGLAVRADGTLKNLTKELSYDLGLEANHASTADFIGLLTGSSGKGANPGALQINGRVVGDLAAAEVDVTSRIGPGEATVAGGLSALAESPKADLQIQAAYPDFGQLVRLFRPEYTPALAELGEFQLTAAARYEPSRLSLSGLQGAIGPVALQGNATLGLDGPRPRLTAELSTSEIIADWFLAPVILAGSPAEGATRDSTTAPASAGGGGRWSSEPIDFSALQAMDAEISISTPSLSYTGYSVDQPQIMLSLDNGVFALKQLSGKAFNGEFSMTAALDTRDNAAAELLLSVTGADAARLVAATRTGREAQSERSDIVGGVLELLFPVSAIGLQSGTVGADFALTTSGNSELELVSNLSGSGEVSFTDAVLEGFSVCNLSAQLDDINGVESILGLALTVEGGTTAIDNFIGRFDIVDGIANLPVQQLDADCATAQLSGNVDLPRWLVDLRANVGFPDHPEFPGVVVEEKGSLDQPNVRLVNVNQVQQYFVSRAADTLLRKLVPDDIVEPAPTPAPERPATTPEQPATAGAPPSAEEPAPAPPADPFIQLLDTLIKNR